MPSARVDLAASAQASYSKFVRAPACFQQAQTILEDKSFDAPLQRLPSFLDVANMGTICTGSFATIDPK